MHAMLSNDYKRKVCCMAAGAPAAFQSENTRVRPHIIDVFHVRSSSTARHTKCNSRQTRCGSASPQSAHTSSCRKRWYFVLARRQLVPKSATSLLRYGQTRVKLTMWHYNRDLWPLSVMWVRVFHPYVPYKYRVWIVCRPSRFEDIAHFLSQH